MAKTASKSFSLCNSSQKPPFFAALMYSVHGHSRYFKFKRKYQKRGPCSQTIFPFLMTIGKTIYIAFINNAYSPNTFSFERHPFTSKFLLKLNINFLADNCLFNFGNFVISNSLILVFFMGSDPVSFM